MKISIPVNEDYETQLKIPKPILMDIFQRCGLENFLKISLISKQFYFLLKSDNFWLKMLKTTDLDQVEIEEQRKTKKLIEIYRDSLVGWDLQASHQNHLKFYKNELTRVNEQGTESAVTKRKFITGEENVLFVLEVKSLCTLTVIGIKKEES